ncbi:uroporphyrinogen-III C-methyltransferase [Amorphus coralli]|uniref:uroporphyrinogen-III C-methyltransferase n=1 Tax=Amorphus coralli TaxID=340680 RepID=UPI00035F398B|nr:uroporphyrinogen-III C-methyltransferase [Amorphus coralli]
MSDSPQTPSFAALDRVGFPSFDPGTVWLVGAGPGAPGLLTLLGYHALTRADAVIYDALVGTEILQWVPQGALLEYAGKRGGKPSAHQSDISTRLVDLARAGKRVLRLKGGDPFMFGRGGEECQTLAAAGVPFRIVPGITAGIGGVGYTGIPVTHRDTNHSVLFLTGHDSSGTVPAGVDWAAVATAAPVLVMYMAVKNLPAIAEKLMDGGRTPDDAVAVVSHATLPEQSVVDSTLGAVGELAAAGALTTPAIVVVGPTVSLRADVGRYVEQMGIGDVG